MSSKKTRYSNVSLPISLVTDISEYLINRPQSSFKSVRDFVIKTLEQSLQDRLNPPDIPPAQDSTAQPEMNSSYSNLLEAVNVKLNKYHDLFALMKKEILAFTNYEDRSREMKGNISLALADYGRRAVGPLATQIDEQRVWLEQVDRQLISIKQNKINRVDIKKLIHETLTERQRKAKLASSRPSSRKPPT